MLRLLINLDESSKRLDWMQTEFARLDLDFQRVPAIGRKDISAELMSEITRPRDDGHDWAPAEVGCFLSHRECWRIAAKSPHSHTAIFEDDIHLAPSAAHFLRDADWIPDHVDIVKLETFHHVTLLGPSRIRFHRHRLARLEKRHYGSAGYIVSRSAARQMLDASNVFDQTVDEFIFDPWEPGKTFNCYQLDPAICIQDSIRHADLATLESIIDFDRQEVRLYDPPNKPRGMAKVKREVTRPFIRLGNRIGKAAVRIGSGKRITKIPFETETRGYRMRAAAESALRRWTTGK